MEDDGPQAAQETTLLGAAAAVDEGDWAQGPWVGLGAAHNPHGHDDTSAEESDSESDEDELPLTERLRRAVVDARAKAGLASWGYRMAVEVFAQTLSRNLRREKRRKALPHTRFPLKRMRVPEGAGQPGAWEDELCRMPGVVPDDFPVPPPPPEPPPKEGEAVAAGPVGPRSAAAWEAERRRQEEHPFAAGRVQEAKVEWSHPVPAPPEGHVWCWGRSADPEAMPQEERSVWARLVAKEARSGALRPVAWTEVDLITPAFINWNAGKPRLVHDLRALNSRMSDFGGLVYEKALDALQYGACVAAKIDILSAFKHVRLGEKEARCMAFRLGDTVWRWDALPFGWSASPALFARALAPVLRRLRLEGIHFVVYVDDILVLADSAEMLDAAIERLFGEMAAAGWHVALDKAFLAPCTVSVFLGRLVDLTTRAIRVAPSKAAKLAHLCEEALGRRYVGLNELQRVGGLLAFFTEAVPEAGLMRTAINAATSEALRLPAGAVRVVGALQQELRGWVTMAPLLTRVPPMPEAGLESKTVVVTDAAGAPYWGWGALAWPGRSEAPDVDAELGRRSAFASATDRQVGVARALYGALPSGKRNSSSTAIEIAAFTAALRKLHAVDPGAVVGCCIAWYGDSQCAVAVLSRWRAKAAGVVGEVLELMALCRKWKCRIVPHWVSRWLGWQPAADFLSRRHWVKAQAGWSMPQAVFERVCTWADWRPATDMFASLANRHCDVAWTRFPEAGAPTDAFAQRWEDVRGWAFPPISMLPRVWQHWTRAARSRVLLVAPATATVPVAMPVGRVLSLGNVRLVRSDGVSAEEPWNTALVVYDLRTVGS
jgi:ribonuclease HI